MRNASLRFSFWTDPPAGISDPPLIFCHIGRAALVNGAASNHRGEQNVKAKVIAYWVTTVIIALLIGSGGIMQVLKRPDAVAGIAALGYPVYFTVLLGVWKILGTVAILAPRFPRL